jgi:hypothetical protein
MDTVIYIADKKTRTPRSRLYHLANLGGNKHHLNIDTSFSSIKSYRRVVFTEISDFVERKIRKDLGRGTQYGFVLEGHEVDVDRRKLEILRKARFVYLIGDESADLIQYLGDETKTWPLLKGEFPSVAAANDGRCLAGPGIQWFDRGAECDAGGRGAPHLAVRVLRGRGVSWCDSQFRAKSWCGCAASVLVLSELHSVVVKGQPFLWWYRK